MIRSSTSASDHLRDSVSLTLPGLLAPMDIKILLPARPIIPLRHAPLTGSSTHQYFDRTQLNTGRNRVFPELRLVRYIQRRTTSECPTNIADS